MPPEAARLLSPPRNWPASFSGKPLQTFLAGLGGQRVRLCSTPDESLALDVNAGAASMEHALAVRRLKGWPVVAGYAVFEREDSPDSFVATEHFWNARGHAGVWVDFSPRSGAETRLVLVEVPGLLSGLPPPEPSETTQSKPSARHAEPAKPRGEAARSEGKYYGGTGASVKKAIDRAEKRDAMMMRRVDKAVASVVEDVANSLLKEAMEYADAVLVEEVAAARQAEAERFAAAEAERECVVAEAERRRAREAQRAADAAKAPARAETASSAAARELDAHGGAGMCWDLRAILAVLTPFKDAGGKCFQVGDHLSALWAYRAAIEGGSAPELRAWPPVESLLLACHANAALCLLRLDRPSDAVAECDAALKLPLASSCGAAMLSKLFLRKAQGLLDAESKAAAAVGGEQGTARSAEWYHSAAAATLLEARRRGLFESGAPASKEFLEQQARLRAPLPPPPEAEAEARMPLREVCEVLLGGFHHDPPRTEEQIDGLVSGLATVLNNQAMEPPSASSTEPGSGISLLWALATGLERFPTDATCDYFERAVDLLMHAPPGEQPVPVDMRLGCDGTSASRTALMQAARALRPSAVQKLLLLGADPVLRDARGVTALMLACMGDDPAAPAAVEVARLLLDAGAPIDAQDIAGQTALMYACSTLHAPLLTHLLRAGARVHFVSATGRTAVGILAASRWGNTQDPTVYVECLSQLLAAWPADRRPQAEAELRAMHFFDMLERELAPVNNRLAGRAGEMSVKSKIEQLDAVLRVLLRHVEMDESILDAAGGDAGAGLAPLGNFLAELHARAVAVIPSALTTVYRAQPSDAELVLITQHSRDAITAAEAAATKAEATTGLRTAAYDRETLRGAVMAPYRHRGRIAQRMRDCLELLVEPIRRGISHAIPSREALAALKRLSPIVECGAGSGYWARQLRDHGADVLAFDAEPPTADGNNGSACRTFCEVGRADCTAVFSERPELAERTLLMVWPVTGVKEDGGDAALWDALCLSSYVQAGGRRVAYVGEREHEIEHTPGKPMDSGISASSRFQALLRSSFRLSSVVGIRQLPFAVDNLSIWERKGAT